jgi:large subunit ribosomal protein L6
LALSLSEGIDIKQEDNLLNLSYANAAMGAMAGTTRALVSNMVKGVSEGWEKKLLLNGVGYRAKVTGDVVNLTVGLSHPVDYQLPEGISAESPSPTEVILRGIDKHAVGQAAAKLRSFRPPEPYKGKGIRYADEVIHRKEAKKK